MKHIIIGFDEKINCSQEYMRLFGEQEGLEPVGPYEFCPDAYKYGIKQHYKRTLEKLESKKFISWIDEEDLELERRFRNHEDAVSRLEGELEELVESDDYEKKRDFLLLKVSYELEKE